jgi:signal transduction histidine kinase
VTDEVERLQRRLDRERAARLEAEAIAERGIRELWEANSRLDRAVAERTAELEAALDTATAARDAVASLFGRVAHELTTPLHAIAGLLELIDGRPLDADSRESLSMARLAAKRAEVSLAVVLELAGAGALPAPLDLRSPASVADEAVSRWLWVSNRRSVLLVADAPTEPAEGRWRVVAALADLLLEAALRAAPPGSLSLQLQARDGIEISVTGRLDRETVDLAATLAEAYGGGALDHTFVVR